MIDNLSSARPTASDTPTGDHARQAVASLRGYAYQVMAATLAWITADETSRLYLEVAEDYAVVATDALRAVQIKHTKASQSVTLNSASVRDAIASFIDLVARNSNTRVDLRFLTTSAVGREQELADRPQGMPGLLYWREVARTNRIDVTPLRNLLDSERFPKSVRNYVKARDDSVLRRELFQRIVWDCDQPSFQTLRQELEERLVVLGRELFGLPAEESRRLTDLLVYRVLERSIRPTPRERCLTRAQLYSTIDAATRVAVPRHSVDTLYRLLSDLPLSFGRSVGAGSHRLTTEANWLIEGSTLPVPRGVLDRVVLESTAAQVLDGFGAVLLVGSSGLGKSLLGRRVASARAGTFFVVEFRNLDVEDTRLRLDMVFTRIGDLPFSVLILDDLNHLEHDRVGLSLARIVEASRRHYCDVIVTGYRHPSPKTLTCLDLVHDCIVQCPYFSEAEVNALVRCNGGDPKLWGRLAFLTGGRGHPQLTHAFIVGVTARGWPLKEVDTIVKSGLSTGDIDAAREAARRNLIGGLPEGTRNLLYRLSIVIGRFNRSLALAIGELTPPVIQAGECLDQLIGPWIESGGEDLFRVSPLAGNSGRETLSDGVQERVHETIATGLLKKETISVDGVDRILAHAILGRSPRSLIAVAQAVLSAGSRTLVAIAEHVVTIRGLRTDAPVYSAEPLASGLVRLAQFKLVVAAGDGERIVEVAGALLREIEYLPEGERRGSFEVFAIASILATMGVANYLDNWVSLLSRFKAAMDAIDVPPELRAHLMNAAWVGNAGVVGGLFSIGTAGVCSVQRLEHIVAELDKLSESERALCLRPIDSSFADYSTLFHGPWSQVSESAFDAGDAAVRYERMAIITGRWGIRAIPLQCVVARAIMLDEFQNDSDGAVAVVEEALRAFGEDVILSRALARIRTRRGESGKAFGIYRSIADRVGHGSPVERTFALRDAAISAGECGEWKLAEKWFGDAQGAATSAHAGDMDVLAIGLGGDGAVATFRAGDVERAFAGVAGAMEALSSVDPEETLRGAHCHRVIRHTVLWMYSRVSGQSVEVDGQPVSLEVGNCSNPSPAEAVRDLPLAHMDVLWYKLAEAEVAAGFGAKARVRLRRRLQAGPIPLLECALTVRVMLDEIDRLDSRAVAGHLAEYLNAAIYLKKDERREQTFDPRAPERGGLRAMGKADMFRTLGRGLAMDVFLAFGIRSALGGRVKAMEELGEALDAIFGGTFPASEVFEHWSGRGNVIGEPERGVLAVIRRLGDDDHVEPYGIWVSGIRFLQWIRGSNARGLLTELLGAWLRNAWERILAEEKFRLVRPSQTTGKIEQVLGRPGNGRRFIVSLSVATAEAVGASLTSVQRGHLEAMAK